MRASITSRRNELIIDLPNDRNVIHAGLKDGCS